MALDRPGQFATGAVSHPRTNKTHKIKHNNKTKQTQTTNTKHKNTKTAQHKTQTQNNKKTPKRSALAARSPRKRYVDAEANCTRGTIATQANECVRPSTRAATTHATNRMAILAHAACAGAAVAAAVAAAAKVGFVPAPGAVPSRRVSQ